MGVQKKTVFGGGGLGGDWGGGRYFCLFVLLFVFCLYHITNLTGGELRDYSLMQDA